MSLAILCKATLAIYACLGFVAFFKGRPDWLLWQLIAALSMGGLNWYAGTIILPVKITLFFSLCYLVNRLGSVGLILDESKNGTVWTLLVLFGLSTCMAFVLPRPDTLVESIGLQGAWLRPFVQLYSYISGLAIFPLALLALNTPEKVRRFFDYYIWIVLFTCAIGFIQLGMNVMGIPFMPILRWNAVHSELAGFGVAGHLVQRLYAFAGEPKHLAVFLLPAVFMVLTTLSSELKAHRPWWAQWWILGVVGIVFVFTFSSAGLIAFGLALVFLAYVVGFRGLRATVMLSIAFVCLLLAVQAVGSLLAVQKTAEGEPGIAEILKDRTITRLHEAKDRMPELQAFNYLANNMKRGLILGLGPGMYVFHLNRIWDTSQGVDPIDSGWVAMLADMGLVGLGAFAVFLYRVWKRNAEIALQATSGTSLNHSIRMACLASLVAAVFLNAGVTAYISICLFMGVLEASRLQFGGLSESANTVPATSSEVREDANVRPSRQHRRVFKRRRPFALLGTDPTRVGDSSAGSATNATHDDLH